ncbi:MAG: hypothetical protein ACLPYB_08920 [Desulfobaccales bacterium]
MAQKEAYQEKIEAQLREWTAKINELKAKADGAKADAKIDMYKRIDALRVKQEAAQAKFQALKQVGTEKWEQLRTGLDQAMEDLKTAWEGSASQREAYLKKGEAQIKEWATKLNKMTAEAQQASVDVKAKMLKEIAEIKDRMDELQQKLSELKSAGAEKWESLKASAEKGMGDLKKRWDSFKMKYL